MTAKTITAIIGDLHIGGNTAIAPPTYTVHHLHPKESQTLKQNELQAWLWRNWLDYWDYVRELAGGRRRKHRLVILCLGDVLEGVHHNSTQLMQEIPDQTNLAKEILQPIRDMADAFYGIQGTGTHAGLNGSEEKEVYQAIDATDYGQQLTLEIDGIVHDLAHHPGGASAKQWTSRAASIAAEVALDYAQVGMKPPDYVWRGHNHVIDDSGLRLPNIRTIFTPSWQLKTEFGYKVSSNKIRSDIGGFVMDGDRLDDSRCRYTGQPDGRKVIKVT